MEPYLSHAEPCYHEEGQNIIELAYKQDDVELVKILDARGFHDHQLWDFVASHGAEKILEFLLTDPEIKVNELGHKMPILATACQDGHYNIVKRLSQIPDFDVDVRIDLYLEGFEGMTALYFTYDNIEIFNLLMDLGASLNVKSEDGRSPLFNAADMCQLLIVRAMINHGAEVAAKDLNKVLSKWTRPDEREEIIKTVEAVLEVLRPGQAEVRAAAEVSPQLSEIVSRAASNPLSLQSLARNSVRGRLREKSGGKTIRPLVERLRGHIPQITMDIINHI